MEAYHKNDTKARIIYVGRKVYDWVCSSVYHEFSDHEYKLS